MNNCYFYLTENKVMCLCEKCGEQNQNAWFWNGQNKGYGPFDFVCQNCGFIVYKNENKTNIQEQGK